MTKQDQIIELLRMNLEMQSWIAEAIVKQKGYPYEDKGSIQEAIDELVENARMLK